MSGILVSQNGPAFGAAVSLCLSPAGGAPAGGDWCEVLAFSNREIALLIGDVAGHGAAVAGTMQALRASVLQRLEGSRVPSEILSAANDVAFALGEGVFATAIVAILDQELRTLTFANAGHPPPLLLTLGRHAFLEQPPADLPLGLFARHIAANYVISLPEDALLVLYTDGITGHDRDSIRGERELVEAAAHAHGRPELSAAHAIADHIFENGRGDDDAAAIVCRTTAKRLPRRR